MDQKTRSLLDTLNAECRQLLSNYIGSEAATEAFNKATAAVTKKTVILLPPLPMRQVHVDVEVTEYGVVKLKPGRRLNVTGSA